MCAGVYDTESLHTIVLEKGLEKCAFQCPLWSLTLALLSTGHYMDSDLQLVAICDTLADVCDISCYYFSVLFIGVCSHELNLCRTCIQSTYHYILYNQAIIIARWK